MGLNREKLGEALEVGDEVLDIGYTEAAFHFDR
jgi:hypothetical protein